METATDTDSSDSICLICLQSSDLKYVGTCQHSFCKECLTGHLEGNEGNEFKCPTCFSPCPIPETGVDGLPDFSTQTQIQLDNGVDSQPCLTPCLIPEKGVDGLPTQADPKEKYATSEPSTIDLPIQHNGGATGPPDFTPQKDIQGTDRTHEPRTKNLQQDIDVKCTVCYNNDVKVQAVILCPVCGKLYLCPQCAEIHAKNKATREHAVITLERDDEDLCRKHGTQLKIYCLTCEIAACGTCVMTEHGSHDVDILTTVIDFRTAKAKRMLAKHQKDLVVFEKGRKELLALNTLAEKGDKLDNLLNGVEKLGDRIHRQVARWKTETKKGLREKYEVISDVRTSLTQYTDQVRDLKAWILRESTVLSDAQQMVQYLQKLTVLLDEISFDLPIALVDTSEYSRKLSNLCKDDYILVPGEGLNIGKIVPSMLSPSFCLNEVAEYTIETDGVIARICVIGNDYIVAAVQESGEKYKFHIFEFPFVSKHQLLLEGFNGMSPTREGQLAVLFVDKRKQYKIQVYNPESGDLVSTTVLNLPRLMYASDFSINPDNRYMILCKNEGYNGYISVLNKNGKVEDTYDLTGIEGHYICTIHVARDGKLIFIHHCSSINVYRLTGDGVKKVNQFPLTYYFWGGQVTTTPRGDFITTGMFNNRSCLRRYCQTGDYEWTKTTEDKVQPERGYNRVATNNGHVIVWASAKVMKLLIQQSHSK